MLSVQIHVVNWRDICKACKASFAMDCKKILTRNSAVRYGRLPTVFESTEFDDEQKSKKSVSRYSN